MPLKLITPPEVEPVTIEQVKAHLNVSHSDDDTLLDLLIGVAREHLDGDDGLLQRALITQTWDLVMDRFPCPGRHWCNNWWGSAGEIRIPLPPLQSIMQINYDDADGNEQTIDPVHYDIDTANQPGWVLPVSGYSWPATFDAVNSVRVRFVAGYASDGNSPADLRANVPKPIKQWMLLNIGTFYAQRETLVVGQPAQQLPWLAEALIQRYQVYV